MFDPCIFGEILCSLLRIMERIQERAGTVLGAGEVCKMIQEQLCQMPELSKCEDTSLGMQAAVEVPATQLFLTNHF